MNTAFVRTRNDRMIAGVCGGLARYLNVDPTLIRLAFVLAVLSGVTPLAYLVLWIVMPEEAVQAPPPMMTSNVEPWRYDPYTGERVQK